MKLTETDVSLHADALCLDFCFSVPLHIKSHQSPAAKQQSDNIIGVYKLFPLSVPFLRNSDLLVQNMPNVVVFVRIVYFYLTLGTTLQNNIHLKCVY